MSEDDEEQWRRNDVVDSQIHQSNRPSGFNNDKANSKTDYNRRRPNESNGKRNDMPNDSHEHLGRKRGRPNNGRGQSPRFGYNGNKNDRGAMRRNNNSNNSNDFNRGMNQRGNGFGGGTGDGPDRGGKRHPQQRLNDFVGDKNHFRAPGGGEREGGMQRYNPKQSFRAGRTDNRNKQSQTLQSQKQIQRHRRPFNGSTPAPQSISPARRNAIPPPPPLPPPPPPPKQQQATQNMQRSGAENAKKINEVPFEPPRVLILSGVPSSVTSSSLRQYFTLDWSAEVELVKIVKDIYTNLPKEKLNVDGHRNAMPSSSFTNKAYVKFYSHEEALNILNYQWKPWDPPILGAESIEVLGMHSRNEIGNLDGEEEITIPASSSKEWYGKRGEENTNNGESTENDKDIEEWYGKNVNDSTNSSIQTKGSSTLQQHHNHSNDNHHPKKVERSQEQGNKRKNEIEAKRKQRQMMVEEKRLVIEEKQRQRTQERRSKRQQLAKIMEKSQQKKELLQKQEQTLQKQLTLHKKMLVLMKNASDKTKKLKEILSLQKKVNKLRTEIKEAITNFDELKAEDRKIVLGPYTKATSTNVGSGQSLRSFQLDKRTTILRVNGLTKDIPLETVKTQFSVHGTINSIRWLQEESSTIATQGNENNNGEEKDILLVDCLNRGVAERIRTNVKQFNDLTLSFAWHQESNSNLKCPPPTMTEVPSEGSNKKEEASTMEDHKREDGNFNWTEEDDLMVDYDYEGDEDEEV